MADRPLRIHARAWGDPRRMARVKLEIVRHGEVIRAAESQDPKRPETELDFTVPAGQGCWIAPPALELATARALTARRCMSSGSDCASGNTTAWRS